LKLTRAGQWERAISVLQAAIADGVEPTTHLFFSAITACGQSGQWQRALKLLREDMMAAGLVPEKHCFNAAIRACASAGKVSEALRVLFVDFPRSRWQSHAPMYENQPDALSFAPILEALARQGDKDLAMGVLREVKPVTQYPPSKYHRRAVASAFLNYGDEDGARGVLEELHGAFRRPNLENTKTGKRKLARMDLGVKAAIEAFDGK
ncbi:unnamed protein product, partial [Sphacelaria rigidula]